MTGRELLKYFANLSGGVDQGHVKRLSERLDCELDKPIRSLSRGNRQKIGLVQAFMHRSELIIMDEPSSGLDPLMQQEFYSLVEGVKAEGRTVFISSHIMPEVERVCDRVGIIRRGELVTVEDIGTLKERAFHQIELHFSGPVPRELFAELPGVRDVTVEDSVVKCTVVGKLTPSSRRQPGSRWSSSSATSRILRMCSSPTTETEAPMLRNVFLKSLRDQRRSFTWWAIGLVALTMLTVLFYPSLGDAPELNELLGDEDSIMRAFVGDITDLTSPEGFLNSQLYFLLVPLLLIVFAVSGGSGAIAGEEEKGTLDLLFSHPVRRSTVVLQKAGSMTISVLVLAAVVGVTVVIGALIVDMDIGMASVAAVTLSSALLGLFFGALALAMGCATGRRGMTLGVTGAAAVFAYFINALRPVSELLEPARFSTPFYYYIGADPLSNGLSLAHAAVLVAATALLCLAAVFSSSDGTSPSSTP